MELIVNAAGFVAVALILWLILRQLAQGHKTLAQVKDGIDHAQAILAEAAELSIAELRRQAARGCGVKSSFAPAPAEAINPEPDNVEIFSSGGKSFHRPRRHPDVAWAFNEPGWYIRLVNGTVEEGVQ